MKKLLTLAALALVPVPAIANDRDDVLSELQQNCREFAEMSLNAKLDGIAKETQLRMVENVMRDRPPSYSTGMYMIIELVYGRDIRPGQPDYRDRLWNLQIDAGEICLRSAEAL